MGRVGLALAAVLALGACRLKPPPPPVLPAGDWSQITARRREAVRNLRAEARVTFTSGDQVFPARMGLAVKRPAKARADLFDPFGALRGIVIIDGRRVLERIPEADGGAPAALLSGLSEVGALGDGLPAEGLAGLLTATSRQPSVTRWWGGEAAETGQAGTVVFLEPGEGEPRARRVRVRGANGESLEVDYGDYEAVSGVPLPRRVTVTASWGWSLEISYRNLEIGVELDDDIFRLPGGPGARQ